MSIPVIIIVHVPHLGSPHCVTVLEVLLETNLACVSCFFSFFSLRRLTSIPVIIIVHVPHLGSPHCVTVLEVLLETNLACVSCFFSFFSWRRLTINFVEILYASLYLCRYDETNPKLFYSEEINGTVIYAKFVLISMKNAKVLNQLMLQMRRAIGMRNV